MRIFSSDAEIRLNEMAKLITSKSANWKAIHFNFAGSIDSFKEGLRTNIAVNIIKDLLKTDEGFIFLCNDGDIFIVLQGQAKPILDKLRKQIPLLPITSSHGDKLIKQSDADICKIYDLSLDADLFKKICQDKVTNLKIELSTNTENKLTITPKTVKIDASLIEKSIAARSKREGITALIIEDDAFTRRLIINSLKGECSNILEAGTGEEAYEHYAYYAPDIVFLDIELPDANGHLILQEIVSNDKFSFVIMLSGHSFKENILAAQEDGAKGFITKPFSKDKLLHYMKICKEAKRFDKSES